MIRDLFQAAHAAVRTITASKVEATGPSPASPRQVLDVARSGRARGPCRPEQADPSSDRVAQRTVTARPDDDTARGFGRRLPPQADQRSCRLTANPAARQARRVWTPSDTNASRMVRRRADRMGLAISPSSAPAMRWLLGGSLAARGRRRWRAPTPDLESRSKLSATSPGFRRSASTASTTGTRSSSGPAREGAARRTTREIGRVVDHPPQPCLERL
jgi:hypothetical protein